ncbi:hypothetical protein KIH39_26455 [Telmatocola sphagniphila]|uniref:Uncharacterized protein n=1 Tax=Telmatocola sphagniphila TaxID=1123043 RepID=A0A8E6EVA2_9BACT|nr:hypothetical protein [Telmatocola sphagniphila]QVL32332.1 hypothetical protein KIH39_26455 [Telmatocola sphagniphila]
MEEFQFPFPVHLPDEMHCFVRNFRDALRNGANPFTLKFDLTSEASKMFGVTFSHDFLEILSHFERGNIVVNNSGSGNVSVQKAGGSMVGVVGAGATAEFGDINAFCTWIKDSEVNADLKSAILGGRDEINREVKDPEEKEAVLEAYKKLAEEAVKQQPKPSVLKTAWGAIKSILSLGEAVPCLVKLGEHLGLPI